MRDSELTALIIGAAIEVHRELGPGLLESSYETCMEYELKSLGLAVQTQLVLPVVYKKIKLNAGYRIDILVENRIVVEIKVVSALAGIHTAQLLNYLRLKKIRVGLLINFNCERVIDGVKRVDNGY